MKNTWFLPPDLTFKPDGPLQLGSIIEHPSKPTSVIASPRTDDIPLPQIQVSVEKNHSHSKEVTRTGTIRFLARWAELISGSVKYEASRRSFIQYGNVDHEVRELTAPFSNEFLQAILALENVQEHMNSGMFPRRKRPIYLVSSLRVPTSSFTVTRETGAGNQVGISATGPAGPVPVEVGGEISGGVDRTKVNSYETAPGIVFAFRVYIIRPKGQGGRAKSEMFTHRAEFATGRADSEPEIMEIIEATPENLREDIDVIATFEEEDLGDGESCLWLSS
ncbi:hypothetical protein ACO1O0_005202 [Amphichorda felina]